jgi:hypothetical protein
MQNKEIFEKYINEFGTEYTTSLTKIISSLYDIKFNAAETIEASEEYDYERQ